MTWIAIALWLVPLIGQVQVRPVSNDTEPLGPLNMDDLGLQFLDKRLCGDGMNFTSPTNVMTKCHGAALGLFIQEFKKVYTHCGENSPVKQTIEVLERAHNKTQAEECTLTMTDHKNFEDLIDAMKHFAWRINSAY
uniref:Interleukin-2-like protein n=1 Tax=Tetraodon nigroviridis TaxID=99883 RepID=B2BHG9_TETNG|nr:interleukin-2-like protein [Tetraodon nigroviridis]